jgi:hypothetical protein
VVPSKCEAGTAVHTARFIEHLNLDVSFNIFLLPCCLDPAGCVSFT